MGNECYAQNIKPFSIDAAQIRLSENGSKLKGNEVQKKQNLQMNPEIYHQQRKLSIKLYSNKSLKKQNHFSSYQQLKKQIQQLYDKCQNSYQQHYIDQAAQHQYQIQSLIQSAQNKKIKYELNQEQTNFLQKIKIQYKDVLFYENEIQKGGWDLKSDKNGIKISCRRQPDGTVGCRIQALSDIPFQILISVMIQMDLYKDYTPFLEISRQQKEVARNCRIGYTLNHFPLMTKRQSFFQGVGYSRLNHTNKQLFLFTRSIHDKKHLQEILNFPVIINQKYIQLDYKYFVVRYRPIKENLGLIDIGMNVDAKMDYIPTWIMEKISKDFGQNFFKNITRISKNFKGSKWQKNVQSNPHLFLYFQKEVKNYLQKHKSN